MEQTAPKNQQTPEPGHGNTSPQAAQEGPIPLRCHCGTLTFTVPHLPDTLNQCQCSFCRKAGALWAYYPASTVRGFARDGSTAVIEEMVPGSVDWVGTTTDKAKALSGTGGGNVNVSGLTELPGFASQDLTGYTQVYSWDTPSREIEFHFCSNCHCLTHWWTIGAPRGSRMGINGRLFDRDVMWNIEWKKESF